MKILHVRKMEIYEKIKNLQKMQEIQKNYLCLFFSHKNDMIFDFKISIYQAQIEMIIQCHLYGKRLIRLKRLKRDMLR